MITTQPYRLKKNDYFKILITLYLRKKWWLLIWIWALMIYDFCRETESFLFFRIFGIIYPVLVVFQLWRYADSEENRNFYLNKQLQISEDGIANVHPGAPVEMIPFGNFVKAKELKSAYLLYLSKNSFLVMPKYVFLSREDMIWFRRTYSSLFK